MGAFRRVGLYSATAGPGGGMFVVLWGFVGNSADKSPRNDKSPQNGPIGAPTASRWDDDGSRARLE